MDIHSNKSGILESPPKIQSEIQSCILNKSESRPNITLKQIGQELELAETKCFTLKSELNYMMGVCRKAQTEIKDSKKMSDIFHEQIKLSPKNLDPKFSIEHQNCKSEITMANETLRYNIPQKVYNIEPNAEEKFDSCHLSPRSAQFCYKKSVQNNDVIKKSDHTGLKEEKQKKLLNITVIPRTTQLDNKLPTAITPVQIKTMEASKEYKDLLSCYPESDRSQSTLSAKGSVERLILKADNDYFYATQTFAKEDIRNTKLNVDISRDTKVRQEKKGRCASRIDKNERNSICKAANTVSKLRKKRGRLRSCSKSTVATKDTRKEGKGYRHKDYGVIHQRSKRSQKSNDVVEIFYNATLKSNNSGVSSKHSKLGRRTKCVQKKQLRVNDNEMAQEKSCEDLCINDHKCQTQKENQQNHYFQTSDCQNSSKMIPENTQKQDHSEKNSNDPLIQCKMHQQEHMFDRYNEPIIRSYEMPTLASKMKRSHRSYLNRFNFRNIPFVVGTSVTPSYNLGLNIQQVLSMMKTRQSIANDITPLIIRKIGRGMQSVSALLEQVNGQYKKSIFDVNSQITELLNKKENSYAGQNKKLSVLDLHVEKAQDVHIPISRNAKMIHERDNDISRRLSQDKNDFYESHEIKQSSSIVNKNSTTANVKNQQEISRMSLSKKNCVGDHKVHASLHNSKQVQDSLIKLHDEFEEMNAKYEKLQTEMVNSGDKALEKELSTLEKELDSKEEEINTVIGLYGEVMMLKQQMRMLHEKNSLVCIKTESHEESKNRFPISIIPGKSHLINTIPMIGRRKRNMYSATRELPASIQLAALLRQIQTFHKQLQLVS